MVFEQALMRVASKVGAGRQGLRYLVHRTTEGAHRDPPSAEHFTHHHHGDNHHYNNTFKRILLLASVSSGAFLILHHDDNDDEAVVRCDEASADKMTADDEPDNKKQVSYQVMAALDKRQELEKVRLAQILHDLHKLAKSKSNQNDRLRKRGTMRRMWTHIASSTSQNSSATNDSRDQEASDDDDDDKKKIVLSREQVRQMVPAKAYELMAKLKKGDSKFSVASVLNVLEVAKSICLTEPTLLDLRKRKDIEQIHVIGDLHGSLASLEHVLSIVGDVIHTNTAYIFNGDFVDRGDNSLEVLLILLLLKITYPQNVYLIRGNHEDILVCSVYGFHEELVQKYGYQDTALIWETVSAAFCAMPLSVVTKNAFIAHGGLPSAKFTLDQLKRVSAEQRSNMKSIVDPQCATDRMVQGILWSDPVEDIKGIRPNTTRSLGVFFGPDVAGNFLKRHSLQYFIRAHELVPHGTSTIECGDGRSVVTVFSQPNYCGQQNLGGVLHLRNDGTLDQTIFSSTMAKATRASHKSEEHYMDSLKEVIESNIPKLRQAFQRENNTLVPTTRWASIMAKTLELEEVPWMILSADLTPPSYDPSTVDWKDFLQMYAKSNNSHQRHRQHHANQELVSMESLYTSQDMVMTTFKFLDSDGTGTIDVQKFRVGVNLLNKRLPTNKRFENPDAMFDQLDKDGSGEIDLEQLQELFKEM